jgi:hypothetical protein
MHTYKQHVATQLTQEILVIMSDMGTDSAEGSFEVDFLRE